MLSHLIEVLRCREHSQLPLVPEMYSGILDLSTNAAINCDDRVVARFGFRASIWTPPALAHSVTLHAWRRFLHCGGKPLEPQRTGKASPRLPCCQMRKRASQSKRLCRNFASRAAFICVRFLVRPKTLERGST